MAVTDERKKFGKKLVFSFLPFWRNVKGKNTGGKKDAI
jgi:hypothetical protein